MGAAWLMIFFTVWCGIAQEEKANQPITYPYIASPTRVKQIKQGYVRIRRGNSADEVKTILGLPDEVRPIFDRKNAKSAKNVGTSYWYFLEKKTKDDNLDAKLVWVSLDLKGVVFRVDHWGFSDVGRGK